MILPYADHDGSRGVARDRRGRRLEAAHIALRLSVRNHGPGRTFYILTEELHGALRFLKPTEGMPRLFDHNNYFDHGGQSCWCSAGSLESAFS